MNNPAIAYMESGEGRPGAPILALHGTAGSASQWNRLREACAGVRSVVAPDLPGYGTAPNSQGSGLDARLQLLLSEFESIEGPMHLVGHSFGGALALRLAERHPERVLSLSIYEPTSLGVFRDASGEGDQSLLQKMRALGARVETASSLDAMAQFIDFWMGEGQWDLLQAAAQQKLAAYASVAAQDFRDGLHEADVSSCLPVFSGPVLVMCGAHTIDVTQRICQLLSEILPDASLQYLADLGHMGPVQNPQRVNETILAHMISAEAAVKSASAGST